MERIFGKRNSQAKKKITFESKKSELSIMENGKWKMEKIKKFIGGLTGLALLFMAILFLTGIIGFISIILTMLKFINQ